MEEHKKLFLAEKAHLHEKLDLIISILNGMRTTNVDRVSPCMSTPLNEDCGGNDEGIDEMAPAPIAQTDFRSGRELLSTIYENDIAEPESVESYNTPPTEIYGENFKGDEGDVFDEVTDKPCRLRKRAFTLCSPYTDPTQKPRYKIDGNLKFDPFCEIDEKKKNAFYKFMDSKIDNPKSIRCGLRYRGRKFFKDILTPKTWLPSEVCSIQLINNIMKFYFLFIVYN